MIYALVLLQFFSQTVSEIGMTLLRAESSLVWMPDSDSRLQTNRRLGLPLNETTFRDRSHYDSSLTRTPPACPALSSSIQDST